MVRSIDPFHVPAEVIQFGNTVGPGLEHDEEALARRPPRSVLRWSGHCVDYSLPCPFNNIES